MVRNSNTFVFAEILYMLHNFRPYSTTLRKVRMQSCAGRVIGYVRVSTDDQALSAEAQRHRIHEWCGIQGSELVAIYEDVGVSGGWALEKRPGILGAIDALKPGMILLATKRDRLARDTMYSAMIERLAAREHATVRTCDGAGNGDSLEDFI